VGQVPRVTQPTFRGEQIGNLTLDRIQGVVRDLMAALRMVPFLWGGKLVSVQFLAGGVRHRVRHGLGVPAAFIVIRSNYAAAPNFGSLLEYLNDGEDLTQYLGIISDVNATVDLWFYPRASKPIDAGQQQSL
jgi:hypothetical protein